MCLKPLGDLTASGKADATDVQCSILMAIAGLADAPPPACLAWLPQVADTNCDNTFNVTDVQIVIRYGLNAPLSVDIDANQDGCPDQCADSCIVDADCQDGDPCTLGDCVSGSGCAYFIDDCDDADECTEEFCNLGVGCAYVDTDCSDGDFCTTDLCQPDDGCYHVGTNCDDNNPCTLDSCDAAVGCIHIQVPGCDPGPCGMLCLLGGNLGQVISCPMKLAVAYQGAPAIAALQFLMKFDNTKVRFVNFYDEYCFTGLGCFEVAVSGQGATILQPTGHNVAIDPFVAANWPGVGAVAIVNTSNPGAPLTVAYLDDDWSLVGDSQFAIAKFELLQPIQPQKSVVCLEKILTSDSNTFTYSAVMKDGVIVSGLSQ
ncbi:MAG: hypothetical protein HUU55_00990 [Myxococcales bacterium]|nr:hypothetical protein [Myxococcales bacterium]